MKRREARKGEEGVAAWPLLGKRKVVWPSKIREGQREHAPVGVSLYLQFAMLIHGASELLVWADGKSERTQLDPPMPCGKMRPWWPWEDGSEKPEKAGGRINVSK